MRTAAILALALFISACGSFSPVPIKGGEVCTSCGQTIADVKVAAEAISPQGRVSVFRTPECLARYTREHPQDVAAKFVTDYYSGRMLRPEAATYVRTVIDEKTNERAYVAFRDVKDAAEFAKVHTSGAVDWLAIQRMAAERRSN